MPPTYQQYCTWKIFVIHTHVVSACCDLDRRARASGKSCNKSSPHTYMNIHFSFLLIFLERPSVISVHLQKKKEAWTKLHIGQTRTKQRWTASTVHRLHAKSWVKRLLFLIIWPFTKHNSYAVSLVFLEITAKGIQWRILRTSITLFPNDCQ